MMNEHALKKQRRGDVGGNCGGGPNDDPGATVTESELDADIDEVPKGPPLPREEPDQLGFGMVSIKHDRNPVGYGVPRESDDRILLKETASLVTQRLPARCNVHAHRAPDH